MNTSIRAPLDHAIALLLPHRLAARRPDPPAQRSLVAPDHADLDRQDPHVDQPRPEAAGEQSDEGAEQTDQQADRGNDEEPAVRERLEGIDLVAEGQELLGHAQAVSELGLPVDDRAGEPAEQGPKQSTDKQAENKSGDRAAEHPAANRQPDQKVVHHAGRRLIRDRPNIATTRTAAGRAKPYAM